MAGGAKTLAAGGAVIDAVGAGLGVRLAGVWQADDAFFDLVRDREAVDAMLPVWGGGRDCLRVPTDG